ncbi:MAG: hypothetical protein HPZ91_10935 [Lentisphaeria bacterium]|nr:hypothetical protein [Lentisphaeria bacterium]
MAFTLAAGISAAAAPVVLDNGTAVAEITPETGRITGWGLKGGENLLWNNTSGTLDHPNVPGWKNYGGDKVWLVPQKLRYNAFGSEAPDRVIDGGPWKVVKRSASSVTIESGRSPYLNCFVTRTVTLDDRLPVLTVTTRVERFAPSPQPVEIWAVSQAKRPEYGLLDLAPDLYPRQPRFWQMRLNRSEVKAEPFGDALEVRFPAKSWDKLNSWGRFVASVYPDVIFLQDFDVADGGCFPERSSAQLYIGDDYVEMECFSPLRHLQAGESMELAVRWTLLPRSGARTREADYGAIRLRLPELETRRWKQAGPGGGGRTMWLSPSPHDPRRMLCSGDMGAVFHSADGGKSWHMNDFEQAERVRYSAGTSPWEYIPSRPGEVWTGSKTRGLLRSRDFGATWQAVPGAWDALTKRDWFHSLGPDLVRFAADGRTGLAGWGAFGDAKEVRLFLTRDAGESWRGVPLPDGAERPMAFWFTSPERALVLGGSTALELDLRSGAVKPLPVEWPAVISSSAAAGGRLLAVMRFPDKTGRLYEIDSATAAASEITCVIDGRAPGISVVAAARNCESTIYVGVRGQTDHPATIRKSVDGGKSWKEVLFRKPGMRCNISRDRWTTGRWGWSGAPASIGVAWNDPGIVTFSDYTMCGISRDGGENWEIVSTGPLDDGRVPGGGTPMLTGWNYLIDGGRHYVSTTDFATWQSRDGGESWEFNQPPAKAVWHNNLYAIAVDPADRDHLYAAASLKHDLPYWHHMITQGSEPRLWRGGVLESADGGRNWAPVLPERSGLPDLPLTDLLMDRDGTLWAASVGGGIFRRGAGEARFAAMNGGLPEENRNALRVTRSPEGALYAVVTAKWDAAKENALSGGVFRFDEKGGEWRKLPLPDEVVFPVNVDFSPDGSALLISCFQQWRERERRGSGAYAAAGLWRSRADGTGAEKLIDGLPVYEAKFRPGHPGWILAGTVGGGLQESRDNGKSWSRAADCPPGAVHTVTFDPGDDAVVWLTTFGQGFWRGRL